MHIGVRRKMLIGYIVAALCGAGVLCAVWPTSSVPLLLFLGYCLILAWCTATISNWWLHRSISRLRRAADAIGQGNLSERVEISKGDELAKLARSFNQMANRLEETVAEERMLQEQLMRSEKLAVIGELAAEVAHEVNNPLDGVQNASRLLRRNLDEPQRVRQMLDLIDTGVYRIEMIIRRLLTMTRDDAPRMGVVRLNEALEDAFVFLEPKTARREIEFAKKLAGPQLSVFGDRQQLTQVMANLMLNAIDSMPEGGTLTVAVEEPDLERGMAVIRVTDTGCGIPEEQRTNIFQPFFTTKAPGSGTGLGLAVVARIVEAHKGTIDVHSAPGRGTSFTVRLPLAKGGEEPVAVPHGDPAIAEKEAVDHGGA